MYAESDSRVKVLHKENGGHTSARNEGLRNASGEYILFLDSDDWISANTLEICYNEIMKNAPDILVYRMQNSNCSVPYKVMFADGCYVICDLESNSQNHFIIAKDGSFAFPKSLSAKCFRREVIYNIQLQIPENILLGEDGAAFIGSILKAKKISVVAHDEKACYYCFVRPDSVSKSADLSAFERATSLLLYYNRILVNASVDYSSQFSRNVVAQLYTATLLVMRGGGNRVQLNNGLAEATKNAVILNGLRKARFSLKGYKFIIKKLILRYRLWGIAKLLDRKRYEGNLQNRRST